VPSDKEILELFASSQTKNRAFELLLQKYNKRVYWQARRIVINHDDADDVVQNTFIKVWQNLADFRDESQLFTWLYRIVTNEALQFLKRKKQNLRIEFNEIYNELSNQLEAGVYFNGNKAQLALQQAILKLPEKQRLVFNMKYFDNLKYEEMEQILGTSTGALKASYHHAVKKIEEILKSSLNVSF